MPRQKNYSIFGNKSRKVQNYLRESDTFTARQPEINIQSNETKKKTLAQYNSKKDKVERLGFVKRGSENFGDTFINNFLRSKEKTDHIKKDPIVAHKNTFIDNGNNNLVDSLRPIPEEDSESQVGYKELGGQASGKELKQSQFCNVVFDERYLTEEEKNLGLRATKKEEFENNMQKNNFVLKSAQHIVSLAEANKKKAKKALQDNIQNMKASKTALNQKQQQIAEEHAKEEKKAKQQLLKQKERNIEKFRKRAEFAELEKASLEDQKKEYERMGPEIMKIMKEVKNIIDVPLFARSEHLKTAIENCKRNPTRTKKVKPYTLEVKESKDKKSPISKNHSQAETGLNDDASFESVPTDNEEDQGPRESFFEESRPVQNEYFAGISVDECSFESIEVEVDHEEVAEEEKIKEELPKMKKMEVNKTEQQASSLSKAEEHYKGNRFDVCSFIKQATKDKNINLLEEVKRKVDGEIKKMDEKRKRKWVGRVQYEEEIREMNRQAGDYNEIIDYGVKKIEAQKLKDVLAMKVENTKLMDKGKRTDEILKRVAAIDAALREAEDRYDREMVFEEHI